MKMRARKCPVGVKKSLRFFSVVRAIAVRSIRDPVNPTWLERIYCEQNFSAPEYQGPVSVVELPGRGRGVVAASDLEPGQLLLVSKPLAYVSCPIGDIPSAEELASQIRERKLGPDDRRVLNGLFSGFDPEDDGADAGDESELDDLKLYGIIGCNSFGEEFTDFPSCMARSEAAATIAAATAGGNAGPGRAEEAVGSSGVGGLGGAGGLAGDSQVGHLGLFPAFSMLNHSCLPNAVNYVVGGNMVVMAARCVPQGAEVRINYLGRASLRPVEERQAQLAEGYHFSCDCPRCRTELLYSCTNALDDVAVALGPGGGDATFLSELQDTLARCEERTGELDALAQPADTGATPHARLDELLDRAREDVRRLDDSIQRTDWTAFVEVPMPLAGGPDAGTGRDKVVRVEVEPGTDVRRWLMGSAFDLLSQHAALAEAAGRQREALEAVERQVAVCEEVAPGSDLHMYLTVKLALMTQAQAEAREQAQAQAGQERVGEEEGEARADRVAGCGRDPEAAAAAWGRCVGLIRARYGSGLSDEAVSALLRGAVAGLSMIVV